VVVVSNFLSSLLISFYRKAVTLGKVMSSLLISFRHKAVTFGKVMSSLLKQASAFVRFPFFAIHVLLLEALHEVSQPVRTHSSRGT